MNNIVIFFIIVISLVVIGLIVWYLLRDNFENDKNSRKIINLCITTIPERLEKLPNVLNFYIYQTLPPDNIYLLIPYFSIRGNKKYLIPNSLLEYTKKNPIIKILRCEDYGPGTKLLGYLEHFKDNDKKIIIVADDDRVIQKDFIEILYKSHLKNKKSIISGIVDKQHCGDYNVKIPWGTSGILIPGEVIKKDIFSIFEKFKNECMYTDDMFWYIYFYQIHNIPLIQSSPSISYVSEHINSKNALVNANDSLQRCGKNGLQNRCYLKSMS
jgi:hypothetical protein